MPRLRLQFDLARVPEFADAYEKRIDMKVERIAPTARARGWFEFDELMVMCKWKSPRTQTRVAGNSEELVHEVMRTRRGRIRRVQPRPRRPVLAAFTPAASIMSASRVDDCRVA